MLSKMQWTVLASIVGSIAGCAGILGIRDVPDDANGDGGGVDGEGSEGTNPPVGGDAANTVPTLGTPLDRVGRPLVNTMLNATFVNAPFLTNSMRDQYNHDDHPAMWKSNWLSQIATNLAVWDGVDGFCGNQFLANVAGGSATYGILAGILADDRLWMKATASQCTTYLAVEANATGFLANDDCGGRRLPYDVVDITYSLLLMGTRTAVTDGVAPSAAKTSDTTFPYLAEPQ